MDLVSKGGHYLKEILILNSLLRKRTQDLHRLKLGLALRLLSKGLFYIRAMGGKYQYGGHNLPPCPDEWNRVTLAKTELLCLENSGA